MKRILFVLAGIVVTVAVVAGVWFTATTIRRLEAELRSQQQRAKLLDAEIALRTRALEEARVQTGVAQAEAERVARTAEEQSAAREAAQAELERSEEARALAEQQIDAVSARENQTRKELDAIRQRRTRELDRMQQALSKIAPTRRTASGMVIELANDSFYFDFDKASLRPENRELLSRIAGVLLASDGYRLFVYGHTDDVGPADYNQQLSERRAKSVAEYLQRAGVPEEIVQMKGFGKSSPRVDNDSREARQKNRRVEIGIVDSIIDYQGLATSGKAL